MSLSRDRRQSHAAVVNLLPWEGVRNDANRRKTASTLLNKSPAVFPGASVTKPQANKPKREKASNAIANELEAADASDKIRNAEYALADNLDSLFIDFNKSCDVLEKAVSSLQFDIEHEEIELGETNGETGFRVRILWHCMEEYQKQVRASTDKLESLWNEWSEVQHDILRLAMEIFGPEVVEQVSVSEENDVLRKDMTQSQQLYDQNSEMMEESQNELLQIQNQLEELTKNSVSESKQHLKAIRIKNREQARVFSKAISAMGEF